MVITNIEILLRFLLPIIIFIGLLVGYIKQKHIFKKCMVDKQILALLTLGAFFTSFINIPIIFGPDLILAVNFAGIIIPIVISVFYIYSLRRYIIWTLISVIIICIMTFSLANVNPEVGIILDFPYYFIPIVFSVLFATLITARESYKAVPIAFSISTLGVFIGTDILLLPKALEQNMRVGYFGGLGVLDLIFISGLIAIAFSLLITMTRFQQISTQDEDGAGEAPAAKHRSDSKKKPYSPGITRVIAFIIDLGIICVLIGIIFILLFGDSISNGRFNFNDLFYGVKWLILLGWAWVIQVFYFTLFEWYSGQTIGKMFMKIRVITIDQPIEKGSNGQIKYHNNFIKIFTRNVLRMIDFLLGFYLLSLFLIAQTQHGQRIGDFFADTAVVRL